MIWLMTTYVRRGCQVLALDLLPQNNPGPDLWQAQSGPHMPNPAEGKNPEWVYAHALALPRP